MTDHTSKELVAAHEPETHEPESDSVVLVPVNLDFFVTSFVVEDVTFTRDGAEVPADKADHFIEAAALSGVVLSRKAN